MGRPTLLNESEAAEYLGGLSTYTLSKWRVTGAGPKFLKVGRLIRYAVVDLDSWLAGCERQSTAA